MGLAASSVGAESKRMISIRNSQRYRLCRSRFRYCRPRRVASSNNGTDMSMRAMLTDAGILKAHLCRFAPLEDCCRRSDTLIREAHLSPPLDCLPRRQHTSHIKHILDGGV